jgi:4-hydroxy-2-oxoheptanedioate aldolase
MTSGDDHNNNGQPLTRGPAGMFRLRQRLADRSQPPLVIVPITLSEPAIVEIAGFAGAEAVMIDCEHGMLGPETIRQMFAHAAAAGIPAVFRPRSFDAAACRQALDQGAAGVHVSHVDTADEARAVVDACRYAPLGRREMSLGRGIRYDIANLAPYVAEANESQLLVVMIESLRGLKNVAEIAAVPGIDVLHIGIADLTHGMGLKLGQPNPEVDRAVEQIIEAADAHGVAVGYPTQDPDAVARWTEKGIRYFEADTPDYLLRSVYAQGFAALRNIFARPAARA